jgi:hypothetical protein
MTVAQSLSNFNRFLIVAHLLAKALIGAASTLFLLLLLVAVNLLITNKQREQVSRSISRCVGLVWASCAGALGNSFLEAGQEYEYELHSALEEKIKVVAKKPLVLNTPPCKSCQYFSWEISATSYLEHPCAVHPSDPSPQCPDYCSISNQSENNNATKHTTQGVSLHDQSE